MSNNPTPTVGQQAQAFRLVALLAAENPLLPAPYVVVHTYWETSVSFQLEIADFEAWREALGFGVENVELKSRGDSWLTVRGLVVRSVDGHDVAAQVQLTGCGLPQLSERPADELVERAA
ncbi:hypothetical protein [Streptomyces sp. CC208A]|uniref:hypothetical protein n=1 Tax=Streptomyces sp. CC208A TaxID=3044573 RepID=UPI0024A8785C|nr:hypothetical protein [Streptomyces sp. CC208A]